MTVASPCIDICAISKTTGYCKGCWRTLEEVAGWITLSDEEKRRVLEQLEERKSCCHSREGGNPVQ